MRAYYHPGYFYALPDGHPFPMEKFHQAATLVARDPAVRIGLAPSVPPELLLRVHTAAYLEAIARAELPDPDRVRLGLPLRPGELLARSRLEAGGTVAAAEAAWADGLAANLAGGTHHAFADRGLGYCVLNDVVLAARHLLTLRPGARIAVVDTDAHQGNGTHALLGGEPQVLTYSIHVEKNYPSAKVPGSIDVGLPRFAPAAEFHQALEATLPEALRRFQPDLAFWIAGADLHRDDRFGQMGLTDEDFARRDATVLDAIAAVGAAACVVYGGGYNRTPGHTARLHAATVRRAAARATDFRPRT